MGILNDEETDKIPGAWTSLTALNYPVASQQPGNAEEKALFTRHH